MVHGNERRRYPRIKDKDISVKLSGDGFSAITKSLDVSASGIYCKVKEHMPLMTRVQIVLSIPGKGPSCPPVNINTEGVVVREHPVKKDGKVDHYDIAIFFNVLTQKERAALVHYIDHKSKEVS